MTLRSFTRGLIAAATITGVSAVGAQGDIRSATLDNIFLGLDADRSGKIERSEVSLQANMLVATLFFQADADGDGHVSHDEARAAVARRPEVWRVITAVRGEPIDSLLEFESISAGLARIWIECGVDALFATVDRDGDGAISRVELGAGADLLESRIGTFAFLSADNDRNGVIDRAELDNAMEEVSLEVFRAVDGDEDGKLTPEEFSTMTRLLGSWVSLAHSVTIPSATTPEMAERMRAWRLLPEDETHDDPDRCR